MSEAVIGAITIAGKEGWSTCECCGTYSWERFVVHKDGVPVLDHSGDGHLGGGEWWNWEAAVTDILTALGYSVAIDIEHVGGDE